MKNTYIFESKFVQFKQNFTYLKNRNIEFDEILSTPI